MLPDENPNKKHAEDSNDEAILAKNSHKDKVYHTVPSGNQTWLGQAPKTRLFWWMFQPHLITGGYHTTTMYTWLVVYLPL